MILGAFHLLPADILPGRVIKEYRYSPYQFDSMVSTHSSRIIHIPNNHLYLLFIGRILAAPLSFIHQLFSNFSKDKHESTDHSSIWPAIGSQPG